jgi:integrase
MGRKGLGNIEVHGDSIRVRFTLEGKRHVKRLTQAGVPLLPTAANLKFARRLAEDIQRKIALGIFSMAEMFPSERAEGPLTIAEQLDTWLGSQRIEASTRASYESAIRFWKAGIGDKTLRAVRHSQFLTVLANRPDLSGKTINNYVSVLREALELAVTDGILDANPAAKIPRARHQKEPPDPFSREELDRILADFASRHAGQVCNLVEFWFWTGLRTSELFALSWENVDLASGTALIAEALVRGIHKDRTKTNVARTIKLNSRAVEALQRQRAHTQLAGGAVFNDPRFGQRWVDERAFRRSFWTPTLKRLGIRYRRPYNMRHTYATTMLMAGMNPAFCARQLGHSVEMFHRTYAKWLDGEQNDREMERLEASIAQQAGTASKVLARPGS